MTNKKPGSYVAIYAALHTTTAKNMLIINLHTYVDLSLRVVFIGNNIGNNRQI